MQHCRMVSVLVYPYSFISIDSSQTRVITGIECESIPSINRVIHKFNCVDKLVNKLIFRARSVEIKKIFALK